MQRRGRAAAASGVGDTRKTPLIRCAWVGVPPRFARACFLHLRRSAVIENVDSTWLMTEVTVAVTHFRTRCFLPATGALHLDWGGRVVQQRVGSRT